jgi:hypothetical protein
MRSNLARSICFGLSLEYIASKTHRALCWPPRSYTAGRYSEIPLLSVTVGVGEKTIAARSETLDRICPPYGASCCRRGSVELSGAPSIRPDAHKRNQT